jgi:choline dehydrogenase-like flavoprotein
MSNPASNLKQPDDVLIVGGGSAGATLAARLSGDLNRRGVGHWAAVPQ